MSIYAEVAFITIYGLMCIGLGAVVGVFWERNIRFKPAPAEADDDDRAFVRK